MSPLHTLHHLPAPWFAHEREMQALYVTLDPAAPHLIVATDGQIDLWDVEEGTRLLHRTHKQYPFRFGAYRDALPFAVVWGPPRKSVSLIDVASGKHIGYLPGSEKPLTTICLSPDGRWLATADEESTMCCWDLHTRQPHFTWQDPKRWMSHLRFSPDSRHLVAHGSHSSQSLLCWHVATGTLLTSLSPVTMQSFRRRGPDPIAAPVFSRDGDTMMLPRNLGHESYAEIPEALQPLRQDQRHHGSGAWRYAFSSGTLRDGLCPFDEAFERDYWVKPQPNPRRSLIHMMERWTVHNRAGVSLLFPSQVAFVGLSHDDQWLIIIDQTHVYRVETAAFFDESLRPQAPLWAQLSQALREGNLSLEEALDQLEQESLLLRWLAVEAALYTTLLLSHDEAARDTIQTLCYHFALESLAYQYEDQKQRYQAFEAAMTEAGLVLHEGWRMVFFSNKAKNAARMARYSTSEAWMCHRLAYLCEVWACCGERSPWLMIEGRCPLEPPAEAMMTPI